jgi:Holliday junction resolvasome RuvABC ATP-dependent DNA helicase subunit
MFDSIISQSEAKSRLKFYAESHAITGVVPPLLFQGPRGIGKTNLVRAFSKELCIARGKKHMEINSSTIKNNKQFFSNIMPQIQGGDWVVFFDESHQIPYDLQCDFLTIFNTEASDKINYGFGSETYEFDFSRLSFILASTDAQKLVGPLRDRFTVVDFSEYKKEELCQILSGAAKVNDTPITFDENLLEEIVYTCRGNPRSCVKMAKDISRYCDSYGATHFDVGSWEDLKSVLGVKPCGLTNDEIQVLRILKERGPCTLQAISSITTQTRSFLQQSVEPHLLKMNLLKIDGSPVRREITPKGLSIL